MESTFNKTFTPLQAGRAYIGSFEKVDAYSSCVISIISNQNCLITAYQSQNKTTEFASTFLYTTLNTQANFNLSLSAPYVYFTVRNESANAQTLLNFTVIYKTAYTQAGAGANSNIFDSEGNNLLSDGSGNMGVKLNAIASSLLQEDNGLKTYIINDSLPFSPTVQRVSATVWAASSIISGATSAKFDCSEVSTTNLSVYGTTSAAGTLTVLFSADNTNFYESQYSQGSSGGFFGFSCPNSAPYIRLIWTGSATTITAIVSAS